MMKVFLIILCLMMSLPAQSGKKKVKVEPLCPKNSVLGYADYAPYTIDHESAKMGLDLEVVKEVFQRLDCPLSYEKHQWPKLIQLITKGQLTAIPGLIYQKKYDQMAYFSDPLRKTEIHLFVKMGKKKRFDIQEPLDILAYRMKIGLLKGRYYGPTFQVLLENEQLKEQFVLFEDKYEMFRQIARGGLTAAAEDLVAGGYESTKRTLLGEIETHPLEIYQSNVHVLFSKKFYHETFLKTFNEQLKAFQQTEAYERLFHRYLFSY